MKKKPLFILLSLIALCILVERVYFLQNRGFRTSKLISPQASIHHVPPEGVDPLLDQPFHFLGAGGTSFVFLGEDGKTILKLFKHQHLFFKDFFYHLLFPGISDAWRIQQIAFRQKKFNHKRAPFFFRSCELAMQELKEETGLIYLSTQPNTYFDRPIRLIDVWGISHTLNLSKTEFAVQKKAELLYPYLDKLLKTGRHEEAKEAIDSLIQQILVRCQKGIGDRDPNLRINFAFLDKKAVEIDLGSYEPNPSLKSPFMAAKEVFFVTSALQKWLEARSPELLQHLLKRIEEKTRENITGWQDSQDKEMLPS